ncbi:hypothetical protein B0H17DRAFT_1075013 [Mycena rosella]|uniref:Uncharacterized protein n=1 Tax=Mycena rosella TaxID=1033263 RepID=A0AAD7D8P4_MYCRO|nr:hypothetical protein B0H17DRAFT_1075013 [Mycena rosella]
MGDTLRSGWCLWFFSLNGAYGIGGFLRLLDKRNAREVVLRSEYLDEPVPSCLDMVGRAVLHQLHGLVDPPHIAAQHDQQVPLAAGGLLHEPRMIPRVIPQRRRLECEEKRDGPRRQLGARHEPHEIVPDEPAVPLLGTHERELRDQEQAARGVPRVEEHVARLGQGPVSDARGTGVVRDEMQPREERVELHVPVPADLLQRGALVRGVRLDRDVVVDQVDAHALGLGIVFPVDGIEE